VYVISTGMVIQGIAAQPTPLNTPDEVKKWLVELVQKVEAGRTACDVLFPDAAQSRVEDQDRAYIAYYVRHGQALGAIGLALRLGQIDAIFYNTMVQRVRATLLPTNVGAQHLGQIGGRQ
jgi:hypothetical protein